MATAAAENPIAPVCGGGSEGVAGGCADALDGLAAWAADVDLACCDPDGLSRLAERVRQGQRTLDLLLTRVGVAADVLAAQGRGRGLTGTLLGTGRHVDGRTARREAERARLARSLSKVGEAVEAGRLGSAQLDALARSASGLTDEQRPALNTDDVISAAESMPVDAFARWVRGEARRIKGDDGVAEAAAKRASSRWTHWFDDEVGMGRISAEFDPERYEAIVAAVERRLGRLANKGGVTKDQNLAAAAAFDLLTGATSGRSGVPHISVVVDWATFAGGQVGHDGSLCETGDGHRLPAEAVRRMACDAVLQRVVLDERGVPVNVGRRHRTATDAQWQAIRSVYRTCAWHGCRRPLGWCQLHHIQEWERGGPTDLDNLIPLCNEHHHLVHEGGWSVRLRPDRTLDLHSPDGELAASTQPDRVNWRLPSHRRREPAEPAAP